jgi:hypothetical protein
MTESAICFWIADVFQIHVAQNATMTHGADSNHTTGGGLL